MCGAWVDPDAPMNSPEQGSLHHVIQFAEGGRYTLDNLSLVHRKCADAHHNAVIRK
jgi:hypothetical protein